VDRLTHERRSITEATATERQKKMFEALTQHNRQPDSVDAPPEGKQRKTIVNLTQKELSADEQSVLSKGGDFAIVPAKLPVEEIIENVKSGIRSLPIHTAEHIRAETSRILQRAKPPKDNLTFGERTALKTLNQDREILILPADKGNANSDHINN